MKKIFLAAFGVAAFFGAQAQDDIDISIDDVDLAKNKKGQVVVPQEGDIGFTLNGTNFVNFAAEVVDIFGSGSPGAPAIESPQLGRLMGRYFLEDTKAIRGIVQIDASTSTTSVTQVGALNDDGTAVLTDGVQDQVEDVVKAKSSDIALGGGMELRRGYGRLQGFYGAQALITYSSSTTTNTYGNTVLAEANAAGVDQTRTDKIKNGAAFGLQIEAFGGVEYFFARKMSVGTELRWGPGINTVGDTKTSTSTSEIASNSSSTDETPSPSAGGGANLTTQASGDIHINFFF